MSGITDFLKIAAGSVKLHKNEELKKPSETKKPDKTESAVAVPERTDQAQISEQARGLLNLRMDAKKYLELIDQSETLSENEVDQLKQKIATKYFTSDEVVDQIVDKLIDLPKFIS